MNAYDWLLELGAVRPMAEVCDTVLVLGTWREGHYPIEWRRIVTRERTPKAVRVDEVWYVLGVQTIDPLSREDCERILRAVGDRAVEARRADK